MNATMHRLLTHLRRPNKVCQLFVDNASIKFRCAFCNELNLFFDTFSLCTACKVTRYCWKSLCSQGKNGKRNTTHKTPLSWGFNTQEKKKE